VGVPVFVGIAVLVAVGCHRWIRPFFLALLVSGTLAAVVFQVVVTIQLGHVDPFFAIAAFITMWGGWVVSLAVGLVMKFLVFDPAEPNAGVAQPQSHGNGEPQRTKGQRH
jgi:type VI protein secretion system component VasK